MSPTTPALLPNYFQSPADMDVERQQPEATQRAANANVDHKPNPHDHTHDDPPLFDGPSSETEEMLPLYTESHIQREADGSIKPPDAKATPDQVRDFIVELLTTKRSLHIDHARRVAAKWTMGNGQEMLSYPPSMYRDIFGFEDGWIVYKEIHTVLHKSGATSRKSSAICAVAFFPPWFLLAGLIIGLTTWWILGVVMIGLAWGILVTMFSDVHESSKERHEAAEAANAARAEERLLAAFDTRPTPPVALFGFTLLWILVTASLFAFSPTGSTSQVVSIFMGMFSLVLVVPCIVFGVTSFQSTETVIQNRLQCQYNRVGAPNQAH
ncbi:hypothetical protein MBLNU230_g7889t1 [Neophaeotheca triangularis]